MVIKLIVIMVDVDDHQADNQYGGDDMIKLIISIVEMDVIIGLMISMVDVGGGRTDNERSIDALVAIKDIIFMVMVVT